MKTASSEVKWLKGIRAKKIVRPKRGAIDLVFAEFIVTYYPTRRSRAAVLAAFSKGGRS